MSRCDGNAWVVTKLTFPDGTHAEVHAHPNHEPEDEARAEALGYPNVDAMTLEHDPLHTIVSAVLLRAASPTLTAVARGERPGYGAGAEEAVVLAVQQFLNALRRR